VSALARAAREFREAAVIVDERRSLIAGALGLLPDFALPAVRARLLRAAGCDIRKSAAILGRVHLVGPRDAARNLRIGPDVIVGPDVTFCLDERITIGRGASIGPRVMLYTASHALGPETRRMARGVAAKPIVVEEGAWIGLAAIILPGVRLGRGCVVQAGAVVTSDVAPNTFVAGNPATVVEELPA
jgi:acetyltransferase-like isoleucine patch superfamily enzyme